MDVQNSWLEKNDARGWEGFSLWIITSRFWPSNASSKWKVFWHFPGRSLSGEVKWGHGHMINLTFLTWSKRFPLMVKWKIIFYVKFVPVHLKNDWSNSVWEIINQPYRNIVKVIIMQVSFFIIVTFNWLHRYWWRMLETKCIGDNF